MEFYAEVLSDWNENYWPNINEMVKVRSSTTNVSARRANQELLLGFDGKTDYFGKLLKIFKGHIVKQ
jgi:hypothetical protein